MTRKKVDKIMLTRWLYCVECPQYSTRLEPLSYLCDCLSGCVQRHNWSKYFDIRRIAVVDGWFSVIRQVTPTCSVRAHWRQWTGSAIFAQLTTKCL